MNKVETLITAYMDTWCWTEYQVADAMRLVLPDCKRPKKRGPPPKASFAPRTADLELWRNLAQHLAHAEDAEDDANNKPNAGSGIRDDIHASCCAGGDG